MGKLKTIEIDKLEKTIKEVIETGYTVYIIINGEYYEIKGGAKNV